MMAIKNIVGNKYSMLTVVSFSKRKDRQTLWNCRCECGNMTIVNGNNLKSGATKSCGCLRYTANKTHGMAGKHPLYDTWLNIRRRCNSEENPAYKYYGGRGIKVCDRWNNFENFLSDMGERPSGTSIDRVNNDGNYSPENCRWATKEEQMNNVRKKKNNKTGITGVYVSAAGRYIVKFRQKYIGTTEDFFEACCLRKSAEAKDALYSRGLH